MTGQGIAVALLMSAVQVFSQTSQGSDAVRKERCSVDDAVMQRTIDSIGREAAGTRRMQRILERQSVVKKPGEPGLTGITNAAPSARDTSARMFKTWPAEYFRLPVSDAESNIFNLECTFTQPLHGTVQYEDSSRYPFASCDIVYTHTPGYAGKDSFTFVAKDPQGLFSRTAKFVISVGSGDYRVDDRIYNGYFSYAHDNTYTFGPRISNAVKRNYHQIFAYVETLLDLHFSEAATGGTILIVLDSSASYAFAGGNSIHLNPAYQATGINGFESPPGSHGYTALLHELGHVFGLRHTFDPPALPTTEDNQSNSVMTYTFDGQEPGMYMPYDILAIQWLYGARSDYRAGANNYVFLNTDKFLVGTEVYYDTAGRTKLSIWDPGGDNRLDFSALPPAGSGYHFDLKPGGRLCRNDCYSPSGSTDKLTYGTTIHYGVMMRRIVNSTSNDLMFAGPAPNVFEGYRPGLVTGNDVIYDAKSSDTVNLRAFPVDTVTSASDGNDLVLTLAANGTIRIVDYSLGHTPVISFAPTTGINGDPLSGPDAFRLYQNYPNPFNPSTTISFTVPLYTDVTFSVFNVLGQQVSVMVQRSVSPGGHTITWDASSASGILPSGVYFYRMDAGTYSETKRMILLR